MVAKAKAIGTDELSAVTAKPIPAPTAPDIAVFRHFGASAFDEFLVASLPPADLLAIGLLATAWLAIALLSINLFFIA